MNMHKEDSLESEISALASSVIEEALVKYPNLKVTEGGEFYTNFFTVEELRCGCKICNKEAPHEIPSRKLNLMNDFRIEWGIPFRPRSVYRCELHPDEQKKDKPGEHTRGAWDVPLRGGAQRYRFVQLAMKLGATGIGVANTFGHMDWRTTIPMVWKY